MSNATRRLVALVEAHIAEHPEAVADLLRAVSAGVDAFAERQRKRLSDDAAHAIHMLMNKVPTRFADALPAARLAFPDGLTDGHSMVEARWWRKFLKLAAHDLGYWIETAYGPAMSAWWRDVALPAVDAERAS